MYVLLHIDSFGRMVDYFINYLDYATLYFYLSGKISMFKTKNKVHIPISLN